MRVVYLTHAIDTRTGVGIFSKNLIEGLTSHGVEPVIFTSESIISRNPFRLLRNLFRIRKEIKKSQLVHALDGFPYGVVAMLTAWGTGVPCMVSTLGTGALQKINHPWYGPLLRYTYRHAKRVVALSSFMARRHQDALPDVPVTHINPGVDTAWWSVVSPAVLPSPYILSVASIKERKGHHISIEIFAKIIEKYPHHKLCIVGNPAQTPAYYARLVSDIKSRALERNVIFLSGCSREKLRSLYQHAELFVLLPISWRGDVEGFGQVFLEASASGIPSVSWRGSGVEDAISDGVSGYLLPADDISGVCASIESILKDRQLREELSVGARAFAKSLSWELQIRKYWNLYEEI